MLRSLVFKFSNHIRIIDTIHARVIPHHYNSQPVMTCEPNNKMAKRTLCIGTHDGKFHCDEVLACYMLRSLPEYCDAEIKRSRDPAVLEECDIVVDVGGVYDPSSHRYDHHQKSFTASLSTLSNGVKKWQTKLSSAGLIYHHFGHRIISQLLGTSQSDTIDVIYDKVYENFMEEMDAIDNGVEQYDGGTMRYRVNTTLSNRVSHLNTPWNHPEHSSRTQQYDQFVKAMKLVGEEFTSCVHGYRDIWLLAREIVQKAIIGRCQVDSSGAIIKLETACPWTDHLFELEKEMNLIGQIKFVLYKESERNRWRIQCVPISVGSFTNRLSLHADWRGLRDAALSESSRIASCVFVHISGFIGSNETYEGALQMGQKTLAASSSNLDS